MPDAGTSPLHYTVYPVEAIRLTSPLGFCMGNVVKYVLRAPWKGGAEDCDKALRYLDFELESFRLGLPPRIYRLWKEDSGRLCDFLWKADGDQLWKDIAITTFGILASIDNYLASGMDEALPAVADAIRELRRVLELASMQGQIYEGMTGRPKLEAENE